MVLQSPNAHTYQGSPLLSRHVLSPLPSMHSVQRVESVPIHTHSPQLSLLSLQIAEAAADPIVDEGDEPEVAVNLFVLADLPDPVYPHIGGRGPKEPLPFIPTRPLKYYVVVKGYKIGIFLEKWYFNL